MLQEEQSAAEAEFHFAEEAIEHSAEHVPTQSMLAWALEALGLWYTILLPLAGLLAFVLTVVLVLRGKGPMAAAAVVVIVHAPLLIGIFAAVEGLIQSFRIMALSPSVPKPSEIADGVSTALFAPLVALLVMMPAYATAAIGTFIRAISAKSDN